MAEKREVKNYIYFVYYVNTKYKIQAILSLKNLKTIRNSVPFVEMKTSSSTFYLYKLILPYAFYIKFN